ncbi:MAG: hypothetical protein IGR92_14780 [Leptolyngbyaceae cyanobacterium T60_A2020_046]|nr:hypothetical protein [Leptolyngbyaceae cyanobacterium T60_A2020_046]
MNITSTAAIVTLMYGVLAIMGGAIGYQQARSKVSLISGSASGALLLVAAVGLLQNQGWGLVLAIAVTVLLIIVFVGRLIKTRKLMPAGLMIVVGVATLATLLQALG